MQHEVFVFFSTIPIKIAENFFGKIFITVTVSMTNFNLKWKLIWRFDMKLSGTPAYIRHLRLCNWELCNNKLTKLNISETNSELSCVMLTEIWKQNGEFVKSLRARKINGSDIDIYQTWLAPCWGLRHRDSLRWTLRNIYAMIARTIKHRYLLKLKRATKSCVYHLTASKA